MSRDSEKKALKTALWYRKWYNNITYIIIFLFLAFRIYIYYSTVTYKLYFGFLFLIFIYFITLRNIYNGASDGLNIDGWQDLLFVSWFVNITSIFSDWFWLFLLVVPLYLIWIWAPTIFSLISYLFGQGEKVEETDAERKKRERKEKRKSHKKVYIRQ